MCHQKEESKLTRNHHHKSFAQFIMIANLFAFDDVLCTAMVSRVSYGMILGNFQNYNVGLGHVYVHNVDFRGFHASSDSLDSVSGSFTTSDSSVR